MKRLVYAASKKQVLKQICDDLLAQGYDAKIDQDKHCVMVRDKNGNIIEQHYAAELDRKPQQKFKYIQVNEGEGNFIRVNYDSQVKDYTSFDHVIHYVNKTNRDKVPR